MKKFTDPHDLAREIRSLAWLIKHTGPDDSTNEDRGVIGNLIADALTANEDFRQNIDGIGNLIADALEVVAEKKESEL